MKIPDPGNISSLDEFQINALINNIHSNLGYLRSKKPGEYTAQFLDRAKLFNMSPKVEFFDVIRFVTWTLKQVSEHPTYFQHKQGMKNILYDCSQYLSFLVGTGTLPREPGKEIPCWTSYES